MLLLWEREEQRKSAGPVAELTVMPQGTVSNSHHCFRGNLICPFPFQTHPHASTKALTYGKRAVFEAACGHSSWLTPRAAVFAYVIALERKYHLAPMQMGRGCNLNAQHMTITDTWFSVKRRFHSFLGLQKILALLKLQKNRWN